MKIRLEFLIAASIFSGVVSCASTDKLVKADNRKKYVELVSNSDGNSAGTTMLKNGELDGAIKRLSSKVKQDPRDVDNRISLSQLYLAKGRIDLAEKHCRAAIKVNVKSRKARKVMAQIALRQKKIDLAAIMLERLGGQDSKDAEVLNMLGQINLSKGDNARAMHLMKKALKLEPGNIGVRLNLAVQFIQYRQLNQAASQLERILQLIPNHPDALMNLAVIKSARGELESAEGIYEDILSEKPNNAVALYNVALIKRKQKDYDEALDSLKEYLRTPNAKKSNGEQVFALIEQIKQEQVEAGERVSDEEIQEMADDVRQTSVAKNVKRRSSKGKSKGGDEISDLEDELTQ